MSSNDLVTRLNSLVHCGCIDEEWDELRYDLVAHLDANPPATGSYFEAMKQANDRITTLEAEIEGLREALDISGVESIERDMREGDLPKSARLIKAKAEAWNKAVAALKGHK